jgi:hypothetical protein
MMFLFDVPVACDDGRVPFVALGYDLIEAVGLL